MTVSKNLSNPVLKRDGNIVPFDSHKISLAISKACTLPGQQLTAGLRDIVENATKVVLSAIEKKYPAGVSVDVESIQDQVELALLRAGELDTAKRFILYRNERAQKRSATAIAATGEKTISVKDSSLFAAVSQSSLTAYVAEVLKGLTSCDVDLIAQQAFKGLYDGVVEKDLMTALVLSAKSLIEKDPQYSLAAARLLQKVINKEVLNKDNPSAFDALNGFSVYVKEGIDADLLDKKLLEFDLEIIANGLNFKADEQFDYLGLQTIYDRYLLHVNGRRIELPQYFFMRVAMGLALNEINREQKAIEFYNLLSSFDFMSSTPTLFNSATKRPQLSSCYLTTIGDDLDSIYLGIRENALLQKFAGGIGNDWTNVRALGSKIKGTNGESQGTIPFLKVANDTALAVNQGGKRKGAVCAFLETWHLDIEEFLELRKNTGDERRRCHDMNTANWIPDLFMKRVIDQGVWTLFSPDDTPDLHDLYGKSFEQAYLNYEKKAAAGQIKLYKQVSAQTLWRKMLTALFETGHPWITFKDPCNIRSPQSHAGVVHSSNLCTEITLNTSDTETAVCNLGSINLAAHIVDGKVDFEKLKKTIFTAIRMLDNVIDINYYASKKSRTSNLTHRPIGMGMMGYADALNMLNIPFSSEENIVFSNDIAEFICYWAYWASAELAAERGSYASFKGSDWSKGILPPDTLDRLAEQRGQALEVQLFEPKMNWDALREKVKLGMRNSNCIAIAPTATISNIIGVSASIEPNYQNLHVKSNMSGEFTVINTYLVNALKNLGLWDDVLIADLKHFDGSVQKLDVVPDFVKEQFKTSFEIDPSWLIRAAAVRQRWIDQAQSLNLYLAQPSGKKLDQMYRLAWTQGLKTTYYLRTLGASGNEKTTQAQNPAQVSQEDAPKFCSIDNPDCEACQ